VYPNMKYGQISPIKQNTENPPMELILPIICEIPSGSAPAPIYTVFDRLPATLTGISVRDERSRPRQDHLLHAKDPNPAGAQAKSQLASPVLGPDARRYQGLLSGASLLSRSGVDRKPRGESQVGSEISPEASRTLLTTSRRDVSVDVASASVAPRRD
jgi:hypothetical protein